MAYINCGRFSQVGWREKWVGPNANIKIYTQWALFSQQVAEFDTNTIHCQGNWVKCCVSDAGVGPHACLTSWKRVNSLGYFCFAHRTYILEASWFGYAVCVNLWITFFIFTSFDAVYIKWLSESSTFSRYEKQEICENSYFWGGVTA